MRGNAVWCLGVVFALSGCEVVGNDAELNSTESFARTGDVIVCEFEDVQDASQKCDDWLEENLPDGCEVAEEDCDMHLHDFWDVFCGGGVNPLAWCVIPFEGWAEHDIRCEYTLECEDEETPDDESTGEGGDEADESADEGGGSEDDTGAESDGSDEGSGDFGDVYTG